MTEQVQTSGFQAPPAVPAAPQFQVPPAGEPARLPVHAATPPNQTPGWLPQGQPTVAPAAAPTEPAAGTPDMQGVVAMLQAALAGAPVEKPAVPAGEVNPDIQRPAWMQESANAFDVSNIDDPIIRSMATIMQTVGKDLDLDRVLGKALAHGDVSLIDEAYLRDSAGANAQQLAEIAKGIVQAVNAKSEAVTASVYASVGGEAAWNASVAAFNKSAPQELRVTVAQMLDSTNEKFITAGAKIVAEFGKSSGMIPQGGAPLLSAAAATSAGQGLTKAQFQSELTKLKADTPGYEEARAALFARRSLGKQSGM